MDSLIKRKSVLKGQMTKLYNYAKSCDQNTAYDDIKVRLDKLNEHYQDFVSVEDDIFKIDSEVPSDMPTIDETFYATTAIFSRLMRPKINAPLVQNNDSTLNQTFAANPTSDYKLPRLSLPTFSGNPREWQSFYDIFRATVHDNTSLSPAQKFQYLKGQLKGTAERLVRHFRVDDANYIEAFQKLVKRYDRKRHIVNEFIDYFMKQPSIKRPDANSIGQLYDISDEVVRGLKALGPHAETRDCWLVYLIEHKLDETTLQLWRQESSENDFPTFPEFLEFLSKRINSLEGSSSVSCDKKPAFKNPPSTKSFHTFKQPPKCSLCNDQLHRLCDCPKFLEMDILNRREFIMKKSRCFNCLSDNHTVKFCSSRKVCHQCKRKHHTLVHHQSYEAPLSSPPPRSTPQPSTSSSSATTLYTLPTKRKTVHSTLTASIHINNATVPDAILPTASIEVQDRFGNWQTCRALLDSASTRSYITEACMNKLNLPRKNARFTISSMNGGSAGSSRGLSILNCRSKYDENYRISIDAYVLQKITSNLPSQGLNCDHLQYLTNLKLADPDFHVPGKIDLLIGCDRFLLLLCDGQIIKKPNHPSAQKTKLGWIVGGSYNQECIANPTTLLTVETESDIDKTLRRFWEIEELPATNQYTDEETQCIAHFNQHTSFRDGRLFVSLPFKPNAPKLGNSLQQALRRFSSLEQKFIRNPDLNTKYTEFMTEYEDLGHMEEINASHIHRPDEMVFYLPHHPVFKDSSSTTKMRVVFDASAKSQSGVSLNDNLMVGPTIQQTLIEILLRFRKHRYIITADVEKMFRQVYVHRRDCDFQRTVWRPNANVPIKHYRLLTVTYGTASASFLATKALNRISEQFGNQFPNAAKVLNRDFYMDDLMTGAMSLEQAQTIQREMIEMLALAGFHLRKWSANHVDLLQHLPKEDQEISSKDITEGTKLISILGIQFNPLRDTFSVTVSLPEVVVNTKRSLLSEASRIFDPLGWLSPVTIRIKILFQNLWRNKLNWDDQLPIEINSDWKKIRSELPELQKLQIPRWLYTCDDTIELCGFCDASEDAYAAVLYSRTISSDDVVLTNLIAAKTKVSPIKTLTIPKLELCAAVLLTKLLETVVKALEVVGSIKIRLWSDSTTVLDWLANPPRRGNIFVSNRVTQILSYTNTRQWNHVASLDNPADCASRGVTPTELQDAKLWWYGPDWLRSQPLMIPKSTRKIKPNQPDVVIALAATNQASTMTPKTTTEFMADVMQKANSITKTVRILSFILRAANNFRLNSTKKLGPLTALELDDALQLMIQHSQHTNFLTEINQLTNNQTINKNSKICFLNPFLDSHGILRVGGRLDNANIGHDIKHPIILAGSDRLSEMIVRNAHYTHLHANTTLLMSIIQQKYHITRCKNLARRIIHQCLQCLRHKHETQHQLMGQLPRSRVNLIRPFLETSVDYAGPYLLRTFHRRSPHRIKGYLVVFTCMATKAIHLELASDMSTETFLAALQRFQNRRGVCTDIFSDNGSNFVGAANEKKYFQEVMMSQTNQSNIIRWAATNSTKWHFVPPASPHFNGLCEAAVKSVKYHLKRVIGNQILSYEELQTILTQIEALLNSRPLCTIQEDTIEALTPSHFLIGQPLTLTPEPDLSHLKISTLSRWQMTTNLFQHFCKRWREEYLTQLNALSKWNQSRKNVEIGDLVILKDDNTPPGQWPLGLITETHPGKDQLVRVVTVKTAHGYYKRPITKICVVPKIDSGIESTGPICWENNQNNSIISTS